MRRSVFQTLAQERLLPVEKLGVLALGLDPELVEKLDPFGEGQPAKLVHEVGFAHDAILPDSEEMEHQGSRPEGFVLRASPVPARQHLRSSWVLLLRQAAPRRRLWRRLAPWRLRGTPRCPESSRRPRLRDRVGAFPAPRRAIPVVPFQVPPL